jgi:hypothetical protein
LEKARGEIINGAANKITCGELLNDLLEHAKTNVKESTSKIWTWRIEANVRPYFGNIKVVRLTAELLRDYRRDRVSDQVTGQIRWSGATTLWMWRTSGQRRN